MKCPSCGRDGQMIRRPYSPNTEVRCTNVSCRNFDEKFYGCTVTEAPRDNVIGLVPPVERTLEDILAETARAQFLELKSFTDAGFTRGEAFDLLRMSIEFENHLYLHSGGEDQS